MSPATVKTHSNAKFWRTIFAIVLAGGFLVGFRHEVSLIRDLLVSILFAFSGRPVDLTLVPEELSALSVFSLGVGIIILGYLLALLWVSRFVLPASNLSDRKEIYKRLFFYNLPLTKSHGPAVFFKEGKPIAEKDELSEAGQGIALLDIYSAIVLEQQSGNGDAKNHGNDGETVSENAVRPLRSSIQVLKKWLVILGLAEKDEEGSIVRALGPGLALTQSGEKINGWADLRKQFRVRNNICSNTGDGIEVSTNVFAVFTLGQSPDILKVAKIDGDWNVIKIENIATDETAPGITHASYKRIKVLFDELSEEDKNEIELFFEQDHFVWSVGDPNKPKNEKEGKLPFVFDEDRVIAAMYSRARDAKEGRLGETTDLPVDVAVEIFRNMLVHKTYDELYVSKDSDEYQLSKFKLKFGSIVKNMGVLGYQIIRRKDGHPLTNDQICGSNELVFSPPRDFTHSAILRDRGIKIIAAGFTNLVPTSDTIQKQFFDNWRAHWQQEAEKTLADHDLQAIRIRNRERARAQQDMIYSLSQILQSEQYTSEALVMRLYQALETAATQPATQRLLPRDTIRMLWNLRKWLLPEENKKDNNISNGITEDDEDDEDE